MRPKRLARRSLVVCMANALGFAIVALILVLTPRSGLGQVQSQGAVRSGATLQPSTRDATAATEFLASVHDFDYFFASRALRHAREALSRDPSLGLARVFAAGLNPDLSREERRAELDRGVVDAARGSASEVVLALSWRAFIVGDMATGRTLMRAAGELMPGDPSVALRIAGLAPRAEAASTLRAAAEKFPDYGPIYNSLGYVLSAQGDSAGGLQAAERQLRLAPNDANPEDTYAELLAWSGRFEEASQHYRRAVEIAPDFADGYVGSAEVAQMQGHGADARVYLTEAVRHASTATDSITYLHDIAGSYFYDGKVREALAQLEVVARQAEVHRLPELAARAHRHTALLAGILGTKDIATHLSAAAALDTTRLPQQLWSALAFAVARQPDKAKPHVDALEQLALADDIDARNAAHNVKGLLLLTGKNTMGAQEELVKGDTTNVLTLALMAEASQIAGNADRTRMLRDRVFARHNLAFLDFERAFAQHPFVLRNQ